MAIRYYNPEKLTGKKLHWALTNTVKDEINTGAVISEAVTPETVLSGEVPIPDNAFGLQALGEITISLPTDPEPKVYTLTLSVEGTPMKNTYELYSYPPSASKVNFDTISHIQENGQHLFLTNKFSEADALLKQGKNVLFLPNEVKESLDGFYCTDFWCYPMFRDICEWMKKPVAIGTMGLLLQKDHPALGEFPTHKYSTPQWYHIVSHSQCVILDDVTEKSYRPIVQMVDNFERNHKLGILFEGKAHGGNLMICTSRLSEIGDKSEVKQFAKSLMNYLTSDAFQPEQNFDMELLKTVF